MAKNKSVINHLTSILVIPPYFDYFADMSEWKVQVLFVFFKLKFLLTKKGLFISIECKTSSWRVMLHFVKAE